LNLLAAMWLQLGLAVVGGKRFLACKFCRRLFEISTDPTGFRNHREFCSGTCKTKDYRRRKQTALQLVAKRISITEIAKRTETASTTVRTWVATRRARKRSNS